jgi:hypothetical protein
MWSHVRTRYGKRIVIDWVVDPAYDRKEPSEPIEFSSEARLYMIPGIRGSAKSSLAETLMEEYLDAGSSVIHMFGANEGEGLASLRSQYAGLMCPDCVQPVGVRVKRSEKTLKTATCFVCETCKKTFTPEEVVAFEKPGKKFLILHGPDVKIEFEEGGIPAKLHAVGRCDKKSITEFSHQDMENYDIILSTTLMYSSPTSENFHLDRIVELMMLRPYWNRLCYNLVLEAADLFFSRLKTRFMANTRIKEDAASLLRKVRHQGIALCLDTQRYMDIDKSIRTSVDFTFLKTQGVERLPPELEWIYIYVTLARLMHLPRSDAIVVSKEGSLGSLRFKPIPWHKLPGEDMLSLFKIKREVLKAYEIRTELSPLEHFEIINLYKHGASMVQIAGIVSKVRGSLSSWTVDKQIQAHNKAVVENKSCPLCAEIPDNDGIDKQELLIKTPRIKIAPVISALGQGTSSISLSPINERDEEFKTALRNELQNVGYDTRLVDSFFAKYTDQNVAKISIAELARNSGMDPTDFERGFQDIKLRLESAGKAALAKLKPDVNGISSVKIILDSHDAATILRSYPNAWIYDLMNSSWLSKGLLLHQQLKSVLPTTSNSSKTEVAGSNAPSTAGY